MPDLRDVTLAILVGGAGRRMGTPKAWLTIRGEPILARLHRTLAWPGPTMLVTVPGRDNPPGRDLYDKLVVDPAEQGPLVGVQTALSHAATDPMVVLPVDMVQVTQAHLKWFVDQLSVHSDDVVATMSVRGISSNAIIEPLPLACRRSLLGVITEQLKRGDRSLRGLLHDGAVKPVTPPRNWSDNVWSNLNTPADLHQIIVGNS